MKRTGILVALAGAVACAAGGAFADAARPDVEVELRLFDALFRGEEPSADTGSLILLVRRYGQRWGRAWGVARDMSVWVLEGRVTDAKLTDRTFDIGLQMALEQSGRAGFQVKLTRDGDGVYRGGYAGVVRAAAVRGKAEAKVLPAHREPGGGFRPVRPGQHPRILFREGDLPRLKARMDTPMGRAALEKMGGPIGLGILHQLTGNREVAQQIIPMVDQLMASGHKCDQYGHNIGARMEQTAIAYDLCYDVWPAQVKRRVEAYLEWGANCVFHGRRDMGSGINWNIVSNWSAPLYAGAGFAGLALWGEKGPAPAGPPPNHSGRVVPAAKGYRPGKGVPVGKFASDTMPGEWIYVAGLKVPPGHDALAALGGAASVRPEVGTAVEFGGRREAFRPLSHEKDKGYYVYGARDGVGGTTVIDLTNAAGRAHFTAGYYYTVIDNDRPRWVRLHTGFGDAAAYLSGVRLADGDCVRIERGLHPLLVEARTDWTVPWGRQFMCPRLAELPEDQAKALAARRQADRQAEIADWQLDLAEWKRTGGQNVAWRKLYERGRHDMYVFCREAVGTGGFQGELSHYSQIATQPPMRYETAHRGMFGYDVSPQADITEVVPRKMFVHLYRPGEAPLAQEINGYPQLECRFFAVAYPVVREAWKPAILWAWNRTALVRSKADDPAVASAQAEPVYTFLHYPPDAKPAPPAGIMPLTWRADEFGFYGFRSSWRGTDDFIVQVFLKAHTIGGWNGPNAGTFRVLGLGDLWAVGPHDRNRCRWEESVVMLPDDPEINAGACARLTACRTEPDGSGVVSMDMRDVYAATRLRDDGRRERLYERYGNILRPEAVRPTGITGMRSIGVDYSRASGAPCLLAIVDRIRGGKKKIWTWQLKRPTQGRRKEPDQPGDLQHTTVDGNTFTIAKPSGATLRGTFITRHALRAEVYTTSMLGGAGGSRGKKLDRPIHGVFAEGGDEFFVVVTIQKGDPPQVRVDGKGLGAKVTVGRRTVRFDGEKVVFGP